MRQSSVNITFTRLSVYENHAVELIHYARVQSRVLVSLTEMVSKSFLCIVALKSDTMTYWVVEVTLDDELHMEHSMAVTEIGRVRQVYPASFEFQDVHGGILSGEKYNF